MEPASVESPSPLDARALADALRGRGLEPDAEAAFAEFTNALTARFFPWFGYAIAASALLWWPLDAWIFAGQPDVQRAYGWFRVTIAALDFGLSRFAPRRPWVARHAAQAATGVTALNLLITGWALAEMGQGSARWLYFGFLGPQVAILLLLPFRARVAATVALTAALVTGWLAHPASSASAPGVPAGLSYFGFSALVSIFFGHALYIVLRSTFTLLRQVDAQRDDLATLAARLGERVDAQTRDLRRLHERAVDLRAEERESVARDLHDDLGQELTSLRLLVGAGRRATDGPERRLFAELDEQVARVQQGLRRVLLALRPQRLDEQGLVEALRVLGLELARRSGLRFTLHARDVPEPLPAAVTVALYFIGQEAMTNAVRHARASSVAVTLVGTSRGIRLTVADDGVGLGEDRIGAGLGTAGIQERAAALGGAAAWRGGDGTRLEVEVPLEAP